MDNQIIIVKKNFTWVPDSLKDKFIEEALRAYFNGADYGIPSIVEMTYDIGDFLLNVSGLRHQNDVEFHFHEMDSFEDGYRDEYYMNVLNQEFDSCTADINKLLEHLQLSHCFLDDNNIRKCIRHYSEEVW